MASQRMARAHQKILDKLGESYVFGSYLEEGTVRAMLDRLGHEGGLGRHITTTAFYHWLDDVEGRRDTWAKVRADRIDLDLDQIKDIADKTTDETVRVDTLKVRALEVAARTGAVRLGKDEKPAGDLGELIGGILKGMAPQLPPAEIPEAEWAPDDS